MQIVKRSVIFILSLVTIFAAGQTMAAHLSITVKNLTNGTYFTPLLIASHSSSVRLFETGQPATAALQAMAEGGDISGLITLVEEGDGTIAEVPENGLLAPGMSKPDVVLSTKANRNRYLSIVAMLLPTNDGFVGLDSLPIPRQPGTYRYFLNGYDAGTEANDERIVEGGGVPGTPGIPAAPGGDGGEGGYGVIEFDTNTYVHIHRSVIGDTDLEGGISDLDSAIHRWLNPVAEVIIVVHPRSNN